MLVRLKQIISESGYKGLIKRLSSRMMREQKMMILLARDSCFGSYQKREKNLILNALLKANDLNKLAQEKHIPYEVIDHYLEHRFDLLGSGWVKNYYGMKCRGLEQYRFEMGQSIEVDSNGLWLHGRINKSNLTHSQKIWRNITPNYQPIDWQLDFKSGYRWFEKKWSKKIKFGRILGVDVKVPWELTRMQHLPQLAIACFSSKMSETYKRRIINEFQNQVLDFIATNPPGYGVNWVCPMDVAIRAVNWLLARDIYLAAHNKFSEQFENILANSIYEHGAYLVKNLEWNPQRANHYLADITGLIFIAAYLPSDDQIDTWLAFGIQELIVEVDRQFYKDGGNFEGSTAYHRLSGEMVYYATALILGLPKERLDKLKTYNYLLFKKQMGKPGLQPAPLPFYNLPDGKSSSPLPSNYFKHIERIAEFIIAITKPNGTIPQVGDNDSGRFVKLEPKYQKMYVKQAKETYANLTNYQELCDDEIYLLENTLDCSHIVCSAMGLFNRIDFDNWINTQLLDSSRLDSIIINALARNIRIESQHSGIISTNITDSLDNSNKEQFNNEILRIQSIDQSSIQKTEFTVCEEDLLEGLKIYAFSDFGVYIYRSKRMYLLIRCWTGEQQEPSYHKHQDQLSVELAVDGHDLIRDPGTYLYTPIPSERFIYQANTSHFSPFIDHNYKGKNYENVFRTIHFERVQLSYFGKRGFIAKSIDSANKEIAICLGNKSVVIYTIHQLDKLNVKSFKYTPPYSQGYGVKLI